MKPYYLLLCFLFTVSVYGQQIKVLDKNTQDPINNVTIYNKDKTKSTLTDINGHASLQDFSTSEVIYFRHIAFNIKNLKKSEILKTSIVYLTPNTQGLEEIILSASRFGQDKRDIPQKIISTNSKNIEFSNPQTSADLLKNTGQVYVQKSQLGGGSPIIRGFSTNRLLITIDGIRMNNAVFRGGNLHNVVSIDPFSVKNTEVILGAGSTIYGSDAIGGVMSFYTQKPQLSYSDSLIINTNAVTRYASANNEKTGHLDLNLGFKKWASFTSVSYSDFDDLQMGQHGPNEYLRKEFVSTTNNQDFIIENNTPLIQKFSGYSQLNLLQKIRYESSKDLSFDFGVYFSSTSNIPRYDRLIEYNGNLLKSAEWYYGPQQWFMSNAQITKLSSQSKIYDKFKIIVAYQNFKESRNNRDFQSVIKNNREEKVDAYSLNLDFEKGLNSKSKFFYGFEYVYNDIQSNAKEIDIITNDSSPSATRYPDGSYWQSAALYSNLKYKPHEKFTFQTGLRFNIVNSFADFTENNEFLNLPFQSSKNDYQAFTGTAGINWFPTRIIQWRLNISSAFRAPNIDDIGKVFDSEPGAVVVPNENLKPEYAYGGELGLALNFKKKITLDFSIYYTYLHDALIRRNFELNGETEIIYDGELSTIQAIQNASKAWIYGFEAGLQAEISSNLKLNANYNIVGGTEKNDGIETPTRHVAPMFGNAHLTWIKNKFKTDFYIDYNGELSFNQLANSEIQKPYLYASDANGDPYSPSWYTLNFGLQYTLNSSLSITSRLENITDQRYRTYSSGITSPGRNIIVAIKYRL